MDIPERDWKHLRKIREAALERLCNRILQEAVALASGSEGTAHARYLALYELIRDRDDDIAWGFNDMRRSRAFERLEAMIHLGLVTEGEVNGFSPATQTDIARIREIRASLGL